MRFFIFLTFLLLISSELLGKKLDENRFILSSHGNTYTITLTDESEKELDFYYNGISLGYQRSFSKYFASKTEAYSLSLSEEGKDNTLFKSDKITGISTQILLGNNFKYTGFNFYTGAEVFFEKIGDDKILDTGFIIGTEYNTLYFTGGLSFIYRNSKAYVGVIDPIEDESTLSSGVVSIYIATTF